MKPAKEMTVTLTLIDEALGMMPANPEIHEIYIASKVPQTLITPADGKEGLAFALRRWTDPETGETQEPLVVCFCDMLANAILTPLPRKTADEIWRAVRDASAEGLRYCVAEEEDEK